MNEKEYREANILLEKRNRPEWTKTIEQLEILNCDNDSKNYSVNYKTDCKGKIKHFSFHRVESIPGAESFKFIEFKPLITGGLTEDILEEIILKNIEIESFNIEDKPCFGVIV